MYLVALAVLIGAAFKIATIVSERRTWAAYTVLLFVTLILLSPYECAGGQGLVPAKNATSDPPAFRCDTIFGTGIPQLNQDAQFTALIAMLTVLSTPLIARWCFNRAIPGRLHGTTSWEVEIPEYGTAGIAEQGRSMTGHQEWLEEISTLLEQRRTIDSALKKKVALARDAGISWEDIGTALEIYPDQAQRMYGAPGKEGGNSTPQWDE